MTLRLWLTSLDPQLWLILVGRLLSQIGTGFTLFYASIYFVNQVGLSATQVGIGLTALAVTGVLGRVLGGSLVDSWFGRKSTLMLALAILALGTAALGWVKAFGLFLVSNLVTGLGQGLYWPAVESIVADLAKREQRNTIFALNRLSDNLGVTLGVAIGGSLVSLTHNYPLLFWLDAASFLVFLGVLAIWIRESRPPTLEVGGPMAGWGVALRDRTLLVFCLANILLTTFLAQLSSGLPLYLNHIVGLPVAQISQLFTVHVLLAVLFQMPVVHYLNRYSSIRGLQTSAVVWLIGFGCAGLTGLLSTHQGAAALWTLGWMALAMVLYNPSASALVVELAPLPLRGVYLSINSLCWAGGYALGPLLSGLMLDLPTPWPHAIWAIWGVSGVWVLVILSFLARMNPVGTLKAAE